MADELPEMTPDGKIRIKDPYVRDFGTVEPDPAAWAEPRLPHEFVPHDRRDEGLICGWCGVTEAEMEAANGRLDPCGILPSERWDART